MRLAATVGLGSVLLVVAGAPRAREARQVQAIRDAVTVQRDVEARMRDGVVLRSDVYHPGGDTRLPVLLQRTPYSKNPGSGTDVFRELAADGYLVVVQDTRGRYMSDGVARPHDEAEDGYDTVEWAADLPESNGRVGTFGGSYLATTQLTAASLSPPHLEVLFPSSSYASRYDMVFQGGAFYLADGLSWNLGQAADVRRRHEHPAVRRDGPIGLTDEQRARLAADWLWHLPLKSIDVPDLRKYAPAYFDMLEHPDFDEYWARFDLAARHERVTVPALHLTGWYDTLLTGTLRNFSGLRAHAATEAARRGQRLVVGPWTHARPTAGSTRIGDVDFGAEAGLDAAALMRRWFGAWRDGRLEELLDEPPVRIFVMGENRWRSEQEWPLARARATRFYLHSAGRANGLDGDGRLSQRAPSDEPADRYTYDPRNPVGTGSMAGYSRSPADQREVERRSDVLVYTSDPLTRPLEVTGPVELVLWASSSARDTDFTGKLVDVLPDGTARALTDGILRARYRNGFRTPELLVPGEAVELVIDLGATSNVFLAGHRIRLEVSSSNFPRFDRNPNTGGTFGEGAELRLARQSIHHDAARSSHLVLPVVARPDLDGPR